MTKPRSLGAAGTSGHTADPRKSLSHCLSDHARGEQPARGQLAPNSGDNEVRARISSQNFIAKIFIATVSPRIGRTE